MEALNSVSKKLQGSHETHHFAVYWYIRSLPSDSAHINSNENNK